jgi:osmoprotectant transport system substrate-binding protein
LQSVVWGCQVVTLVVAASKYNTEEESEMRGKRLVLCLVILLLAGGMIIGGCDGTGGDKPVISVGSKEFTTQIVKGQLAVQLLEANGFKVKDSTGLGGSSVCREALERGDIDIYWEYTGTAWMTHFGNDTPITDSEECYQKVKEIDEGNGITWLPYCEQNDTYTVMMRKEDAEAMNIVTISDLAEAINFGVDPPGADKWVFAADHEYSVREDGVGALQELYGFEFDEVVIMEVGITYGSLRDGKVPTAMGFATDGRVLGFNLVNLVDDKFFHPVYNASLNVRTDILEKYPEIEEIFADLFPLITNENMTYLNAQVDIEGKEPDEVAREFLIGHGFLEE